MTASERLVQLLSLQQNEAVAVHNPSATDKYLFEVDDLDQLANKDKITLKIDAVSEADSPVED